MKALIPVAVLVVGLLGATLWYKRAFDSRQQQLAMVTDTLSRLMLQQYELADKWNANDLLNTDLDRILGPKNLELGDSLLEIHRIRWTTDVCFAFLFKQYKTGEVSLQYRRFTLRNPLTGVGETTVFSSEMRNVSAVDFQNFKTKMAAVSFFDATRDDNPMCCLTTGSLNWEARLSDNSQLKHHTSCRQSRQFSAACESIMRLVQDPKLQQALGAAGQ